MTGGRSMWNSGVVGALVLAFAVIGTVAAPGYAQGDKGEKGEVGGKWNLTVKGPAAHGDIAATMVLNQSGTKVTGSFAAHGNEHTVAGEFSKGTLTLEATDVPDDKKLSFTARLQSDGSLSGYVSGPMGDMTWTATRAREQH